MVFQVCSQGVKCLPWAADLAQGLLAAAPAPIFVEDLSMNPHLFPALVLLVAAASASAADWPMWRQGPARAAQTDEAMPSKLQLQWSRPLPALRPAYRDARLQFDGGYEPVVVGQTLLLASSREDALLAFDLSSGRELWRARADGPVRLAPVVVGDLAIFGSDDGWVRAVDWRDGHQVWGRRALPASRQLLGNQRMISVWPVRGGMVAREGKIWFAAGVWPLEGVFVFCWDAATGREIWCNDRCSFIYGKQPHDGEALSGLAPQGYLLLQGDELIVPCSNAYPARLKAQSGELIEWQLPTAGRLPGGWFAATPAEQEQAKLKRRGLLTDAAVNTKRHEDKPRAEGEDGVRRRLWCAGKAWSFDGPWPQFEQPVHAVVLANGHCVVSGSEGRIAVYAEKPQPSPKHWSLPPVPTPAKQPLVETVCKAMGPMRGWVLLDGAGPEGFLPSLLAHSAFQVLVLGGSPQLRAMLEERRLYGERVALVEKLADLPPYFASLVISDREAGQVLRPQVGLHLQWNGQPKLRRGPLAGAASYHGDWKAQEDLKVRAPLGLLWFDDALGNFKRAPQPRVIDSWMITTDKDWLDASNRKGKVDYRLRPAVFSDVYTGRVLDAYELPQSFREQHGKVDEVSIQPAQYRPPSQTHDWSPGQPQPGQRTNLLTGESEPRRFPKSYGCDGGFDYGGLYTFRSAVASFYDKSVESGTVSISGPRSGCTNSMIPAAGVLSVPYFYEGCTCSYPLPVALALVSMPEEFEQWAMWGEQPVEQLQGKIERVGINLGAPGDRSTRDGLLWLEHPATAAPSPRVEVRTKPAEPTYFYRHSLWMQPGEGWPWVAASGALGLQSIEVSGLRPGRYRLKLHVASPDEQAHEMRIGPAGQMREVKALHRRSGVQAWEAVEVGADGLMRVELESLRGPTVLCGLELWRS